MEILLVIVAIVLILAVVVLALSFNDIRRYLRMRNM